MTRQQRIACSLLAAFAATAYLVAMVLSGALPSSRQRIEFEAHGLMELTPEHVSRVTVSDKDSELSFARDGETWIATGHADAMSPQWASTLERAVKFMHSSAPVRVFAGDVLEAQGEAAFGLDRPSYRVELSNENGVLLQASFGDLNADGFLQYLRVQGRDELYLMSRFVAAEWGAVLGGAKH